MTIPLSVCALRKHTSACCGRASARFTSRGHFSVS